MFFPLLVFHNLCRSSPRVKRVWRIRYTTLLSISCELGLALKKIVQNSKSKPKKFSILCTFEDDFQVLRRCRAQAPKHLFLERKLSETHTKRQVTRHDCLPSLLGDVEKWTKIGCGEEKNILYWPTRAAKVDKNILYLQEGPLSFVLFEFPFASVSTAVSKGHHSLVSLEPVMPSFRYMEL